MTTEIAVAGGERAGVGRSWADSGADAGEDPATSAEALSEDAAGRPETGEPSLARSLLDMRVALEALAEEVRGLERSGRDDADAFRRLAESLADATARLGTTLDATQARSVAMEAAVDALRTEIVARSQQQRTDMLLLGQRVEGVEALLAPPQVARPPAGGPMLRKTRRFLRLLTRRSDLARLVAPAFRPLLEASIVEGGVTGRDSLTLSPPLADGVLLPYRLPAGDYELAAVEIALSPGSLLPHQRVELRFDIFEATTFRVLLGGSWTSTPGPMAAPVPLAFAPLRVTRGQVLFLRLGGSPPLGEAGVRAYEWQRLAVAGGRVRTERRLFGRVVRPSDRPAPRS